MARAPNDPFWENRRLEKLRFHAFASKITKVPKTVRMYTDVGYETKQVRTKKTHKSKADSLTADMTAGSNKINTLRENEPLEDAHADMDNFVKSSLEE